MEFYINITSEEIDLHTSHYKNFYTRVNTGLKDVLTKKSKSPDKIECMILCMCYIVCIC